MAHYAPPLTGWRKKVPNTLNPFRYYWWVITTWRDLIAPHDDNCGVCKDFHNQGDIGKLPLMDWPHER